MAELPEVLGVVYPVSNEIVNNIFSKGKNMFLKFTTHEPSKKTKIRIKNDIKVYFYKTGGEKLIIGEATVSSSEYLAINEILPKFEDRIVISPQDLISYSSGRENKKILVLRINNPKKYVKPIKLSKPITMAGLYITSENKKEIFKK